MSLGRFWIALWQQPCLKQLDAAARNAIRMSRSADGDGRRLLNLVEQLDIAARRGAHRTDIDQAFVETAITRSLRRFDRGRRLFYDQISALHKSVRGSNPDASLYWSLCMLDGADRSMSGAALVPWRVRTSGWPFAGAAADARCGRDVRASWIARRRARVGRSRAVRGEEQRRADAAYTRRARSWPTVRARFRYTSAQCTHPADEGNLGYGKDYRYARTMSRMLTAAVRPIFRQHDCRELLSAHGSRSRIKNSRKTRTRSVPAIATVTRVAARPRILTSIASFHAHAGTHVFRTCAVRQRTAARRLVASPHDRHPAIAHRRERRGRASPTAASCSTPPASTCSSPSANRSRRGRRTSSAAQCAVSSRSARPR